eukprot:CAMPEP_0179482174 /NCGR_PEP_ID=MMETSP0799-20121207/59744_1 /TAXON_ID=46947 /ORGANISM="Geminigera cryophila, Strain CCMP2564" /LENGTH=136 /DNA_ID=CAMNT_0021295201 /DNA_START=96 /DNA_END=503 /DNA_ORIENTATION=+
MASDNLPEPEEPEAGVTGFLRRDKRLPARRSLTAVLTLDIVASLSMAPALALAPVPDPGPPSRSAVLPSGVLLLCSRCEVSPPSSPSSFSACLSSTFPFALLVLAQSPGRSASPPRALPSSTCMLQSYTLCSFADW